MSARSKPSTPSTLRGDGHPKPLALQRKAAAEVLGMGVDHFDREVRPVIPVARSGSLRLWPVAELERWLDERLEDPPGTGAER